MEYKNEWNAAFERYLRELDAKKPIIWTGDFNCAPTEKDIRHAKPNWDKTPVSLLLIHCHDMQNVLVVYLTHIRDPGLYKSRIGRLFLTVKSSDRFWPWASYRCLARKAPWYCWAVHILQLQVQMQRKGDWWVQRHYLMRQPLSILTLWTFRHRTCILRTQAGGLTLSFCPNELQIGPKCAKFDMNGTSRYSWWKCTGPSDDPLLLFGIVLLVRTLLASFCSYGASDHVPVVLDLEGVL